MYNIGLALSGGGAKGIAHLGIIKALEEHDLRPEIMSGVSAGAIVAALYADNHTPEEICEFFKETKFFSFVKFNLRRKKFNGLMSQERFEEMLGKELRSKTFEQLSMPIYINATDITDGRNVFFSSGPLVEKIVASASVPVFLTPKEINGHQYVDGGIFNNMPSRIIRSQCRYLIGCHVNPIVQEEPITEILKVFERVYDLCIQSSTVPEKAVCDLLFEPIEAKHYGIFDIDHTEEIFNVGYEFASRLLDKADLSVINRWLRNK